MGPRSKRALTTGSWPASAARIREDTPVSVELALGSALASSSRSDTASRPERHKIRLGASGCELRIMKIRRQLAVFGTTVTAEPEKKRVWEYTCASEGATESRAYARHSPRIGGPSRKGGRVPASQAHRRALAPLVGRRYWTSTLASSSLCRETNGGKQRSLGGSLLHKQVLKRLIATAYFHQNQAKGFVQK